MVFLQNTCDELMAVFNLRGEDEVRGWPLKSVNFIELVQCEVKGRTLYLEGSSTESYLC